VSLGVEIKGSTGEEESLKVLGGCGGKKGSFHPGRDRSGD
jgi:hypothetical protein